MKFAPKSKKLIEQLFRWQLNDELRLAQNGMSIPFDRDTCERYLETTYDGAVNQMIGVETDDGKLLGCYMLEGVDRRNLNVHMHIVFTPEGRGKALKESYVKVMDYVFGELHMAKAFGIIATHNEPACAFVERAGWRKLCVIPCYFSLPGGMKDANYYMITAPERKF